MKQRILSNRTPRCHRRPVIARECSAVLQHFQTSPGRGGGLLLNDRFRSRRFRLKYPHPLALQLFHHGRLLRALLQGVTVSHALGRVPHQRTPAFRLLHLHSWQQTPSQPPGPTLRELPWGSNLLALPPQSPCLGASSEAQWGHWKCQCLGAACSGKWALHLVHSPVEGAGTSTFLPAAFTQSVLSSTGMNLHHATTPRPSIRHLVASRLRIVSLATLFTCLHTLHGYPAKVSHTLRARACPGFLHHHLGSAWPHNPMRYRLHVLLQRLLPLLAPYRPMKWEAGQPLALCPDCLPYGGE